MAPDDVAFSEARRLSALLKQRRLSAVELMRTVLARIERVNPLVNAIVSLRATDELVEEAESADRLLAAGATVGPLHGLPLAIKDLSLTRGLRTTFGSRIYADFIPEHDALYVERLKRAGAIIIGKTNTPEFGAGSQTFNAVFGVTRNPYDLRKTAGGSSGGAAAALAAGLLPLADGTDVGGSLRNPASFCNVVGFRPSPGRVPRLAARPTDWLGVHGPMARTVADVAWLLSIMAGPDARDPAALQEPGALFGGPLERSFRGSRVAFSDGLGRYPVEAEVLGVCHRARRVFAGLGCEVIEGEPRFDGVDELFQTARALDYAAAHAHELERHRALLKDTVIWNIERGLAVTEDERARASVIKAQLDENIERFFAENDFLVAPVVQVVPFDLDVEWVHAIDGQPMHTYIDWMATCYAISAAGLPAISVPAGFTAEGLPVGIQIASAPGKDLEVLQLAEAFERATGFGRHRPALP